jgi:hypothetical protein
LHDQIGSFFMSRQALKSCFYNNMPPTAPGSWSDNLQIILERTVTIELPRIVISCGCMSRSRVDPRRLFRRQSVHGMVLAAALITFQPALLADESPDEMIVATHPTQPADQRILGVIPNYQTVSDPTAPFVPLTGREKWKLFAKSTTDPFTAGSAFLGSALSQHGNNHPKYGNGDKAYAQRFGAAMADFTTQSLFSGAVLASVLHQDPRYFRKGPSKGILYRAGYSVSRIVVTRQDSGRSAFNFSGLFGMGLGIAASNLYYPDGSRTGSVMKARIGTSLNGGVIGNLLAEFWPDIRTRVLNRFGPWKKIARL